MVNNLPSYSAGIAPERPLVAAAEASHGVRVTVRSMANKRSFISPFFELWFISLPPALLAHSLTVAYEVKTPIEPWPLFTVTTLPPGTPAHRRLASKHRGQICSLNIACISGAFPSE